MPDDPWPRLEHATLQPTLETLHLWTQLVGKAKLASLPWLNHSWHVPLYVSARGLTTGLVAGDRQAFEMELDLLDGALRLRLVDGSVREVPLVAGSLADFAGAVRRMLDDAGLDLEIDPTPCEIEDAVRFDEDHAERVYDPEAAVAYWRALVRAQRAFHRFRSRFTGKCSPIQFFWGSFDLAVTRFSGRVAPDVTHGGPGLPLAVARDAYDRELCSAGFWPGSADAGPAFYVEAWPEPADFPSARLDAPATYDRNLGEWILRYSDVVHGDDPDGALMRFLEGAYGHVADANRWDRGLLERAEGPVGRPPTA